MCSEDHTGVSQRKPMPKPVKRRFTKPELETQFQDVAIDTDLHMAFRPTVI